MFFYELIRNDPNKYLRSSYSPCGFNLNVMFTSHP